MDYSREEHIHRFAAWAAFRAAGRVIRKAGKGLSGEKCLEITRLAGLGDLIGDPNKLPNPQEIDAKHVKWREKVIEAAMSADFEVSHGAAAKMINVFLKAAYCSGWPG